MAHEIDLKKYQIHTDIIVETYNKNQDNQGIKHTEKYIDDIVGLDKVQDSFLRLTNGKDDAIKIIIHPNK